ncbi:ras-related protein Rab-30-like isoform X1 [Varroa destructor]|uniref:Ras-related protein Rab-30 n=3 Tax=Varroa TaxID=62624 RepID=A0A7M7IYI3_VARDE|nr:ras-related protein Rab-30-like isoform X1 [Varroa destructor]
MEVINLLITIIRLLFSFFNRRPPRNCPTCKMEDYKFLFKVVLIGNAGVGKTCLVRRFTQGMFPPGQGATIGVDFLIKTVEVDGDKVKLQIWDTAGQERFRSITQSYYRSAHALVLVYDISSQPSFDCLPDWLREIEQYASPKVLRAVVGNKIDRDDREIPTHIGEEFARRNDMYFIETSAKEADNVEKLFTEIAHRLTQEARASRYSTSGPAAPELSQYPSKSDNACCKIMQ